MQPNQAASNAPGSAGAAPRSLLPLIPYAPDAELSPLGTSLMHILSRRKSERAFAARELSLYTLSQLLWSACGINRPDEGRRTAASAKDWQEIEIYIALEEGLYLFDASAFALHLVLPHDLRGATGWQDFVPQAPVNLVYVADLARMDSAPRSEQKFYAAIDTGIICQNVYLFCAAEGLATVARGWVERPKLAELMGLRPEQRIILAQSVGYPP